jgi:ribosomal protein S18 acetylase RimI-like enzyme
MSVTVGPLLPPLPTPTSQDGQALLALEVATQERPLPLHELLREATPEGDGVVLVARDPARDQARDQARDPASDPEGAIVGMASARRMVDEVHVMRLVVAEGSRRRGTGRALLEGLIGWARTGGADAVLLEVRAGNGAALALYGRMGFAPEGRRPRYYPDGEDALLLRRVLSGDVPVRG